MCVFAALLICHEGRKCVSTQKLRCQATKKYYMYINILYIDQRVKFDKQRADELEGNIQNPTVV